MNPPSTRARKAAKKAAAASRATASKKAPQSRGTKAGRVGWVAIDVPATKSASASGTYLLVALRRLLGRADAMGIPLPAAGTTGSDQDLYVQIRKNTAALAKLGLAREAAASVGSGEITAETARAAVDEAMDALEHNPMPSTEWTAVRTVLGDDMTASIVGSSLVSMRRYASGARGTPDDIAARLHFVALVNADLAGSYNEMGMRRWWQRPRGALGGRSPIDALGTEWHPDHSASADTVRRLAAALVGAGSAS
jgi:hypothetical protein